MKKLILGIILAIGFISIGIAAPAFAAEVSPFNGTYSGIAHGDFHSSAPLTLEVTQIGENVTATIDIEEGLNVNAGGFCGSVAIPAGSMWAESIDQDDSLNGLRVRVPFDVGGHQITADITGEMSANGEEMDVQVKVNTPFLCRYDPVITSTLTAQ